jgi:hypothetical protein
MEYAIWLALQIGAAAPMQAQLRLLPDEHPQNVFAAEAQAISLRWSNPGLQPVSAEIRARIFQTSSSTAAPFGEVPWKHLTVLPGQTVLESAALTFPSVRAETRFLVQWVADTNRLLGATEILVFPPDLLSALKPLLGGTPLGIFDPVNQLKPLLTAASIEISDLEDIGLDHFVGKLAVIGPIESRSQMRGGFAAGIKALAAKGVGVVWMQPPPQRRQMLKPSFQTVREGKGAVVLVAYELLKNLRNTPQAQLDLVQLCQLALSPEPLRLPELVREH